MPCISLDDDEMGVHQICLSLDDDEVQFSTSLADFCCG
jgi:hypothetical protein